MWALAEAKLCTVHDLRTVLTLEDYARACLHIKKRNDDMRVAQQRAEGQAMLRQRGGG